MSNVIPYLPSIICAVIASIMALRGTDGWGWFLFAAVLLAGAGVEGSR